MKIIHTLDDIGQPLSCTEWGDVGTVGIPPIINGTSITDDSLIRNWFAPDPSSGALYPLTIFINEKMEILQFSIRGWQDALKFISDIKWDFKEQDKINKEGNGQ